MVLEPDRSQFIVSDVWPQSYIVRTPMSSTGRAGRCWSPTSVGQGLFSLYGFGQSSPQELAFGAKLGPRSIFYEHSSQQKL